MRRFLLLVLALTVSTTGCDVAPGEAASGASSVPGPVTAEIAATAASLDDGSASEAVIQAAAAIDAEPPSWVAEIEPALERIRERDPARFEGARFARPDHVRGLYINAWAAGTSSRMDELIEIARETEINSFVIDIKDATGYLSHTTSIPMAREIGADGQRRIADLPALLDRLEAEGIYPVARIVVVKDPLLIEARPELAIQDTAGGVWVDSKEIIWLNPYSSEVWDYHVDIAREVAAMGFPEIQWDYIRFPDAPEHDMNRALFPGGEGVERTDAIRGFLVRAQDGLSEYPVRSTADVFGVTTSFRRDIGLGQLWESFIDVVDVALPMIYPSHYWQDSFGYDKPNAYPYEVVLAALQDANKRSAAVEGAGLTRPWLQDFTLGSPAYGAPEVRAQIQAVYDAGLSEWVLWNPGSRYSRAALEPTTGFESEPLMRVAGRLAGVSRRREVIESMESLPTLPDFLIGDFEDDYGIRYSIDRDRWLQGADTEYRIERWDPSSRQLVLRGPVQEDDPGLWTRIDWVELEDEGSGFGWAFCYTAYDQSSEQRVLDAPSADRVNPMTGCGGYPFSRMRPLADDGS